MYYIGIDLGGTNIAVGLVNDKGEILEAMSTPTLSPRSYTEIVADMVRLSREVVKKAGLQMSDVKSIGVGSPGSIDDDKGMVVYANNLRLDHAPIREEIRKYIDLPVHLENDANAAAFGEYVVNANGAKNVIFVTLGTGVGGGIIIDGKIYKGFNGAGGELGHFILIKDGLQCTCGLKGCWEQYASVTALISQTKAAMEKNPDSLMVKIAEEKGVVNGRTAFEAAKMGDEAAKEVVRRYTEYVSAGVVSIINIFQPEKLIIGGGISREGDYLLNPIREFSKKYSYKCDGGKTEIQAATLFNDAGIIGAALAAR